MFFRLRLFFIMSRQMKREDTFIQRFMANYRADNPNKRELHQMIKKLAGDLHYMETKVITMVGDSEDYEFAIEQNKCEIKKLKNE